MKRNTTSAGVETQSTAMHHLLDGERISFSNEVSKPKVSDEELNSRYAKGEIRMVTEQARYPLAGILDMLKERIDGEKEPRYKLDPEYQRRHRWSVERKSRLIESFLMNVPVPPVFLYEYELARFEVMDGRQRLTALNQFYNNEFPLAGLQYWSDLNGRTYSALPAKIRDGIDRRYISSIILLKETAIDNEQATMLKKMIFERLNSGGVKLSSQETRNAVYGGPLNNLCISLSENKNFRSMWGIPIDPLPMEKEEDERNEENVDEPTQTGIRMFQTMEDVELVLRFFAYRQIDVFKAGLNKISEFLDFFIAQGNNFAQTLLDNYEKMFESTVSFLRDALGADSFTVIGYSKRPMKIVYDSMMFVASSDAVCPYYTKLIEHNDVLRENLAKMYKEEKELFSGRRTNFANTQERNHCVRDVFKTVIAKIKQ